MKLLHRTTQIRDDISAQKAMGASIGFVPTMGALHRGHLSLIQKSISENDYTVVSIFVNPLQFGANEDFDKYPQTPEQDRILVQEAGADVIFHPSARDILVDSMLTFVDIEEMQNNLCGLKRPGHFRGVCTIVCKLFNIVTPDRAYFGQKDIQQFFILRKMVQDLNFNIQVISCPIVREADGLAMSSRNSYLSADERRDAVILSRAIKRAAELFHFGLLSSEKMIQELSEFMANNSNAKIDYVSIVDEQMRNVMTIQNGHIVALAAYIGTTRLIDNFIFGESLSF